MLFYLLSSCRTIYRSGYDSIEKIDNAYVVKKPYNLVATGKERGRFWWRATWGTVMATTIAGGTGYLLGNETNDSKKGAIIAGGSIFSLYTLIMLGAKKSVYDNTGIDQGWLTRVGKDLNLKNPKLTYSSIGCDQIIIEDGKNKYEKIIELQSNGTNFSLFNPISQKNQKGFWVGDVKNDRPNGKGYFFYEGSRGVYDGAFDYNGYPSGDGKYVGDYKEQFGFVQANFIKGIPNGACLSHTVMVQSML